MRSVYLGASLGFACLGILSITDVQAFPVTDDLKPVHCNFGKDGNFQSAAEYRIYKLHEQVEEYKYFDKHCTGVVDQIALQDYIQTAVIHDADRLYQRYHDNHVAIPVPPEKDSPTPKDGGWRGPNFVLRDSFDAISIFSKPKDVKLANGATFSYGRDDVAANTTWTAKGVVAYPFS